MIGRMVASSRFFVLIATLSLFLAFMAVMVSTMIVTVVTILHAMGVDYDGMSQNEMIGKLIKQADYALLATVLYVLALGLYVATRGERPAERPTGALPAAQPVDAQALGTVLPTPTVSPRSRSKRPIAIADVALPPDACP